MPRIKGSIFVFNENFKKPKGFISAYMHRGGMQFVHIGTEPKQGYYIIPEASIVNEMHMKNMIVTKASTLMANRMRPGASWESGIGYLEVGTGVGTGTTDNPQKETVTDEHLKVPLARNPITSWTYIDSAGNPVVGPTNRLRLTTTFAEAEALGAQTEIGLFGGNATSTLDSGYMFNYKTHPVWTKTNDLQLTIVWDLTF
jgi:hypothetical protein